MYEQPDDSQMRHVAEKRVEAKLSFRANLTAYLIVNLIIFLVWLIIALIWGHGNWFPWFLFPLLGWGIGIIFHYRDVYGAKGDAHKREALIQKEMEKMRPGNKE